MTVPKAPVPHPGSSGPHTSGPDTQNPNPPARVFKQPFQGSLGERALYIYLPPSYHDPGAGNTYYPVLYLHDGQNCFEAFVEDSFSGSWRADETAERLITEGQLRPCIIVGVSNGGEARLTEYLPPYSYFGTAPPRRYSYRLRRRRQLSRWGQAHRTFAFYGEVAAYLASSFRTLRGREHTATCGSSMGGLFSAYVALEHPEFARHHGILSAPFWVTQTRRGELQMLTRLRAAPVHDLRLWLDSGEGEGDSDDNKEVTLLARQALLDAGYREVEKIEFEKIERGKLEQSAGFVYHLAEGASHSEAAWAARLPQVLSYLFPPEHIPQRGARAADTSPGGDV